MEKWNIISTNKSLKLKFFLIGNEVEKKYSIAISFWINYY